MFSSGLKHNRQEYQYIYGKIVKYTIIEDNFYSRSKREYIKVDLPNDAFANPIESDYIFIPAIHRFLLKKGKVGVKNVAAFLKAAFELYLAKNENVEVEIKVDSNIIEALMQAEAILGMDIKVTYTNDDVGPEAQQIMDELMKEAGIGKFNASLRPDAKQTLNSESTFVGGLIKLAENNGEIKATIINREGNREKIETNDYPSLTKIISDNESQVNETAALNFLNQFPRTNENSN